MFESLEYMYEKARIEDKLKKAEEEIIANRIISSRRKDKRRKKAEKKPFPGATLLIRKLNSFFP